MKWEPVAAMVALLLLGVWMVYQPSVRHDLRPGAQTSRFTIGGLKGELESVRGADGQSTFRFLYRDGQSSPVLTGAQFEATFGPEALAEAARTQGNGVFRLLNVTSWSGLVWVLVGFGGQMAFFGRMAVQWLASEKHRQSVVPPSFWWMSLAGGVMLFVYFVWRQDLVAVLGQTSGVVIYARNLRLIHKQRRRDARGEAAPATPGA